MLRFYSPLNPTGSCQVRSVYLTTLLLHKLSPLSGLPVLCTFFRQKLTTLLLESAEGRESISWSISMEECCWTSNPLITSHICIQLSHQDWLCLEITKPKSFNNGNRKYWDLQSANSLKVAKNSSLGEILPKITGLIGKFQPWYRPISLAYTDWEYGTVILGYMARDMNCQFTLANTISLDYSIRLGIQILKQHLR